ncbi:Protein of unknown function, DUF393 [Paracoccus saliphilus]|uniref:DUF393 domain-containing protein n=2 Tax=Paracoccus saliphilus TaxID=405559 RepID=A0AA46A454_9RHOB|nr:Protein of unknown function, DUF393 [Paracoccus saliphilus]
MAESGESMSAGLEIYYDGECPFCRAYMRMLNLRRAVGEVELIDARSDDPRVAVLTEAGFDLDEGMAVRHGAQIFHGAEAIRLLAVLSEERGVLRMVLRSPRRAAIIYPILRAGRRLTLRLLNRQGLH